MLEPEGDERVVPGPGHHAPGGAVGELADLVVDARGGAQGAQPNQGGSVGAGVPLDEQDRALWDTAEITEGVQVLQAARAWTGDGGRLR